MATTEVERLVVRLLGDNFAYLASLKVSSAATTKFAVSAIASFKAVGTAAVAMGTKIKAVGSRLSMYLTAPLLLIAAASTMAFAGFDKAMIESTSIMKVTTAQAEEMRRVALALATDGRVPQGPKDLAKSYFFLASAGFSAEQSMKALPQVAMFATAGAFDMATATSLAADAQSALGLKAADAGENLKNLTRVTDVLVRANTLANANVEQFSTALTSKAGAALKSYSKSIEEGVAVLAAFADQGVKSQLAGNNLSRIMLLLSKAENMNSKMLKKYNIEVFNSAGAMRNFADIVQDMEVSFSTMSDKQRSAALMSMGFSARVQGAILPLIGTSEAIRRYQKELEKASGYTKMVAEKQMESFSNQMAVVKNRVIEMGISIGESLAPYIKSLGERVDKWTKQWKELTPEVKEMIVQIGLWAMAAGPALTIVGSLVTMFGMFVVSIAGVASAIGALFTPAGLLVATLAAILYYTDAGGQLLAWFGKKWEQLSDYVKPAVEGIKNALSAGDLKLAIKIGWKQIEIAWAEGIEPLREAWDDFLSGLVKTWEDLPSRMEETEKGLKGLFRTVTEPIATALLAPRVQIDVFGTESLEDLSKQMDAEQAAQKASISAMFDAWEKGSPTVSKEVAQKASQAAARAQGLSGAAGDPIWVQKAKAAAAARRAIANAAESAAKEHASTLAGIDKVAGDKMIARNKQLADLLAEQKALLEKAEQAAKDVKVAQDIALKKPELPEIKAPEIGDPAKLLGFDEPVIVKVKPQLLPAVEWGSAEMLAQLTEYMRGAPKVAMDVAVAGQLSPRQEIRKAERDMEERARRIPQLPGGEMVLPGGGKGEAGMDWSLPTPINVPIAPTPAEEKELAVMKEMRESLKALVKGQQTLEFSEVGD